MREVLGARQAREQRTCVKTKGTSSRGKEEGAGWNKTLRYLEALKRTMRFWTGAGEDLLYRKGNERNVQSGQSRANRPGVVKKQCKKKQHSRDMNAIDSIQRAASHSCLILCRLYMALAPGYRPGACIPFGGPIIVAGGLMPLPLPRAPYPPLPRPLPMPTPGIAKSGLAALASRITSSGLIGLAPPRPLYGPKLPAGAPISGRQFGFTGRCDTDVKCDASDAAGLLLPSGRSS